MGDYSREKWDNINGECCGCEPRDDVNHPVHYNTGSIETFDYIVDKLTIEELRGYIKGNVLKYVSRERYKSGLDDLRKARWYLNKYIEIMDNVDVSIVGNGGNLNIRHSDKYGTTVQEQQKPEMPCEERNSVHTIEPKETEKRWVDILERQLDMLESILDPEDTTSQQKDRKCTNAFLRCHQPAGESL